MSSMNGWALAPTGIGAMDGARRRRAKPVAGAAITAMLVAIGLPLAATSASAVVSPPHLISVFPARDFVMAEGYTPGSAHTVNVLRGGFVAGTSQAVANAAGIIEINHPAVAPDTTNCWNVVTPDIRPADVIQVLTGTIADETTAAGITVTQQATFVGGTVTIKGTAPGAIAGTRIDINLLEARAVARQTKFMANGKTSLRADASGTADGVLAYDTPTGNTWTATFTGMTAVNPVDGISDGNRAVSSESRGLWIPNLNEVTLFEMGPSAGSIFGGPALPDCTAPLAAGPTRATMTAATDTGVSTTDLITRNQTPTFVGSTSTAGATKVNLYVDDVLSGTDAALVGGAYSIVPTAALTPGTHTITAGEVGPNTGGTELMGNAPASITIEVTAPTTTDVTPLAGTPDASQMTNVTATFSEDVFGFTDPTLFTLKAAASGLPVAAQVSYNSATHTATLTPAAPLLPAITYIATLTAGLGDLAGNPLTESTWSFTTGSTPLVLTTSPPVNQAGNFTASFSENVRASVSDTTFTLTTGTAVVPATVGYDATTNVATLDPTAMLAPGTTYTATLTSGIKDLDLNPITATSWSFTTGPRATVIKKSPAVNRTLVAQAANVAARFSENVSGVNRTTFTLRKAGTGVALAAVVSYNATTKVALLNPTAMLAPGTRYTVALKSGIRDAELNPLTTTSWSFTTGPRPTVSRKSPAANVLGVSRTANVTANFSENVRGVSWRTFTLKKTANSANVKVIVLYNARTHVATLNPSSALAANTRYTATLSSLIKDAEGNRMTTTSWRFTTRR
jgi:hypothetical protein